MLHSVSEISPRQRPSSNLSDPVLDLVIETSKAAREQLTSGSYQSTHEEIQTLLATLPQTVCDVQEQLSVKRKSWQMTSWNIPIEKAKKWVNCEF